MAGMMYKKHARDRETITVRLESGARLGCQRSEQASESEAALAPMNVLAGRGFLSSLFTVCC